MAPKIGVLGTGRMGARVAQIGNTTGFALLRCYAGPDARNR
jgi:phosphoglycerate dehydrogenase-like enzyme